MKKIYFSAWLAIIILISSCTKGGEARNPEGYQEGTDFQYFQVSAFKTRPKIQETEDGCIFMHKDFVYRYDRETDMIMPLCSKANCLHDKETDPERLKECSAHIEDMIKVLGDVTDPYQMLSLMLYKDFVYICYNSKDNSKMSYPCNVIKIALDGSSKEMIYQQNNMEKPLVHRGYLYYFSYGYTVSDNEIHSNVGLLRINLESPVLKPELIFDSPYEIQGWGSLKAYGKNIYFDFAEDPGLPPMKWLYNIDDNEIQKFGNVGDLGFLDRNIYALYFPSGMDIYDKTELLKTDLNGSEEEIVFSEIESGKCLQSDAEYLYISNGWLSYQFDEEDNRPKPEENHFWVYNKNMELIDDFCMPDTYPEDDVDPSLGGRCQYLVFDDEITGEWGLYIWDKSEIGRLHGKPYTQQKTVYESGK